MERLYGENQVAAIYYRLSLLNAPDIHDYLTQQDYYDAQGRYNTYYAYLKAINNFHNIPVVVAEYGGTTGRGRAQIDVNTGRSQGFLSEEEHGQ